MTDRELLELAAKAAGISKQWDGSLVDRSHPERVWNLLNSDADAFRLAVKLGLELNICAPLAKTICWHSRRDAIVEFHDHSDPYIATRRAITRAAAAIGEQK